MAAYISVPRDLTKVKSKVAFNLTKRQLICFGTAALIGVPLFFLLRDSGGNSAATLGMMAVMLPAFFLGMYEKNGQPLEKLLSYYVRARFLRPKIRPYKTENYYALLMKGGMDSSQIVTMHIQSVDQNRAIKTVKRTITELDRSKIEEQKKAIRAGYDIDISATRS